MVNAEVSLSILRMFGTDAGVHLMAWLNAEVSPNLLRMFVTDAGVDPIAWLHMRE